LLVPFAFVWVDGNSTMREGTPTINTFLAINQLLLIYKINFVHIGIHSNYPRENCVIFDWKSNKKYIKLKICNLTNKRKGLFGDTIQTVKCTVPIHRKLIVDCGYRFYRIPLCNPALSWIFRFYLASNRLKIINKYGISCFIIALLNHFSTDSQRTYCAQCRGDSMDGHRLVQWHMDFGRIVHWKCDFQMAYSHGSPLHLSLLSGTAMDLAKTWPLGPIGNRLISRCG
jgi:hypothetical protein